MPKKITIQLPTSGAEMGKSIRENVKVFSKGVNFISKELKDAYREALQKNKQTGRGKKGKRKITRLKRRRRQQKGGLIPLAVAAAVPVLAKTIGLGVLGGASWFGGHKLAELMD